MRVFTNKRSEQDFAALGARAHPWTEADHDPLQRYEDFKKHPERIEQVLVDFAPWKARQEVSAFFDLVRFLNEADGALETNDCGFVGPHRNEAEDEPLDVKGQSRRACTRLMLFYRDLAMNMRPDATEWLLGAFNHYLEEYPAQPTIVVGLNHCPCEYLGVGMGRELSIEWWTWGCDDDEVLARFSEAVAGVRWSAEHIQREMRES